MSQAKAKPSREVFIVRVWSESDDPGSWRGEIQHVSSGETVYVQTIGGLFDYLQEKVKPHRQAAASTASPGLH